MRKQKDNSPTNLFVAYHRASTDMQRASGLGIEAQRDAIHAFISQRDAILYACFTEIESGTHNNRPGLKQALNLARSVGATLLIAKLDRLARNVHFISGLMESGVNFIALDFPDANRFTLHIMAAVAEHEAEMISKRTSDAIQAKLSRGAKWGFALPARSHLLEIRRNAAIEFANRMSPVLKNYLQDKYSLSKIAAELNQQGYETASGLTGSWTARSVKNCLAWSENE